MQIQSAAMSDVPRLSAPADPARFVQVVGERIALLGRESGTFECWMWPLELCRELRLELFRSREVEPIGELEREVEVAPGELVFTLRGEGCELRWRLFACRERRALVMGFELDGDGPLEIELSFRCVFRPMWPAGLGGQIGARDPASGAFLMTEELGRFAALLGGPGFELQGGGPDHALPDGPVRLRAALAPGSPKLFVVAGAQLDPDPLSDAARLGRGQSAVGLARAQPVIDAARELWGELLESWPAEREALEEHWREFLARTTSLESCDPALDRAFLWAQVAVERAWARVDGLGRGLLAGLAPAAGSGRPGYGWFFDGDALVACRAMSAQGDFAGAREVLRFAASHQRADGKLMHELTLSAQLCDWIGDYPYAYYKGLNAAEFVISLERYVRASGDLDLARELASNLKRAIRWCAGCADEAGRLRVEKTGVAAVEAGPLSDCIESDVFLQGAWMGALEAAQRLAVDLGEEILAAWASDLLDQARAGFEGFASPAGGYGFALLEGGQRADDSSAYLGYPLAQGFGEPARALAASAALNHPLLCADWGARQFATDSAVYDPADYNTGAVFPHLTGFVGLALFRHALAPAAHQVLGSLVELSGFGGQGLIEEHLRGDRAEVPDRGVPHQIFSSCAVAELVLSGLFGLQPDGVAGSLTLAPCLPPHWERAALRNLRVGATVLDVGVSRERHEGETLTHIDVTCREGPPLKLTVAPLLPPLSRVRRAGIEGAKVTTEPRVEPSGALRVLFEERELVDRLSFALTAAEGPAPSFPSGPLERGQVSRQLRPYDQRADAESVTWSIAGPAGSPVEVALFSDLPVDLHVSDNFPAASPGTFTSIELTARLQAETP